MVHNTNSTKKAARKGPTKAERLRFVVTHMSTEELREFAKEINIDVDAEALQPALPPAGPLCPGGASAQEKQQRKAQARQRLEFHDGFPNGLAPTHRSLLMKVVLAKLREKASAPDTAA